MKHKKITLTLFLLNLCIAYSCKQFIEIDAPKNSIVPARVFQNNDLATAAVLGIYQEMAKAGFASGNEGSISTITATVADEYIGYNTNLKLAFELQLSPEITSPTNTLWNNMYQRIYDANAILEGLGSGSGITPPVKSQLRGEVLFVRAFNYFYLANLYGPVPLNLTTDYKANSNRERTQVDEVYQQIVRDLQEAANLLSDSYITTERIRPNKDTAYALLARTFFYMGDWINAEKYASLIIEKTNSYKLTALNEVFLSNSLETIWQLMPPANSNTPAGNLLILNSVPTFVSLRADFVNNAFELGDLRKGAWIRNITINGVTYYYPFKYKVKASTSVTEYYTVFRLSEQVLIRAEARAMQGNLAGAINDLDKVRERAGLTLIKNSQPNIDQPNLLLVVQRERRSEFFSEWGDRWLELKRNGNTVSSLISLKPNIKPYHKLFPIPSSEISANKNAVQNDGY